MEVDYYKFALSMYLKNCKERFAHGEEPYKSFEAYEKANRDLIQDLFDSK